MIKEYKTITLQEIDSIAVLKLNRPEKLNAFNMQMLEDIMDAFDEVDRNDNLKAIILSGAGKAFSAGGNVKNMPPAQAALFSSNHSKLVRQTKMAATA